MAHALVGDKIRQHLLADTLKQPARPDRLLHNRRLAAAQPHLFHARPGDGTFFERYPEWASREAVPVEMKAGSCTFHNGLTLHGAGYNMTPGRRRAMTCAYMPAGSIFNGQQNVLPKTYFDSLEMGQVCTPQMVLAMMCALDDSNILLRVCVGGQLLDNDDLNPLVYSTSRM